MRNAFLVGALGLALTLPAARSLAQNAGGLSVEDLAKAIQNPVSDTTSVPFQSTALFGTGPHKQTGYTLNIQPVVPFDLNDDWNLITRTTIPTTAQVRMAPDQGPIYGLGDVNSILAISPAHPGPVIWGVGPAISLPTASQKRLGTGLWNAGPAAVALVMPDPWVIGILVNNLWSVAGPSQRGRVNQTNIQYFVAYNLPDGTYFSSTPTNSANWAAASNKDRWEVPVGGGIGHMFFIGDQAVDLNVGAYYSAVKTTYGPQWQAQFNVTFLFPK